MPINNVKVNSSIPSFIPIKESFDPDVCEVSLLDLSQSSPEL